MTDRYLEAFIEDGDDNLVQADREMVSFADVMRDVKAIAKIPQSLDYAEFSKGEWENLRRALTVAGAMIDDAYQACRRNIGFGFNRELDLEEYDPAGSASEHAFKLLAEYGDRD